MSHKSEVQKLLTDMATAASATATAAIFTNPAEVIKTRLQLQGEMKTSIADGAPRYTGVGDAVVKIARHEGIAALQKGLGAGMIYQVFMNGTRLGCYPSLKRLLNYDSSESIANFARGLTAGAISGGMGAIVGSPFYMVKCRLQAQSTVIGVDGFQHHYKGMVDGLGKVWKAEGLKGWFRGVDGAVPRVMVGSASQLATYDACKKRILATGYFHDNTMCHFTASMISGVVVTTALNPFDLVSTRLYNQPQGAARLYSGPLDCFIKTARAEGFLGFYKGWFAHYCRLSSSISSFERQRPSALHMARPHMAQGPANPPLARLCATAAAPPHPLGVQYLIRHHRHRLFVLGAASGAGEREMTRHAHAVLGNTPLHLAAKENRIDDVKKILAAEATDPSAADELGMTPLHYAAMHDNKQIVKMLCDGGANPNAQDIKGRTPLHLCMPMGYSACVVHLYASGVDDQIVDSQGRTALSETSESFGPQNY